MFQRILIASRGEIALRVMRTAREMGIECVSVYSDFDQKALHARLGDLAVGLGGALPSESYLDGAKILAAAASTGAEAAMSEITSLADFTNASITAPADSRVRGVNAPTTTMARSDRLTARRGV